MQRYTIIHPVFMSFYSKSLYKDVAMNWKGFGFIYLFVLLAFCCIPVMIKNHWRLSNFVANEAPAIVKQIPLIMIKQGRVSIEESMPYYVKDIINDITLMIIDTTGQFISLNNTQAFILLTKDHCIVSVRRLVKWFPPHRSHLTDFKIADKSRILPLSNIDEVNIDHKKIYRWLGIIKDWYAIILFPLVLLGSFFYRIFQILIYAIIGLFFTKIFNIYLNYKTLVRLSAVAITPVILLDIIHSLLYLLIPLSLIIYFIIAMGYLLFAVKVNS